MRKGKILIGNKIFPILITESSLEREKGLMNVSPPVPSMLFDFGSNRVNKFWMKNTPAPLDIVFCSNGKIVDICYGEPNSTKLIGGDYNSNIVVEFPYGTCSREHISIGDEISVI